ncbi:MaoC family dehydratase [Xanthobacter sp. DSM 24535]|uniref:MaoC family dehydratase n=1 Tax=Roseixanthobacter psychrophilus TaxID=3119917 RepID=UPI00372989DA
MLVVANTQDLSAHIGRKLGPTEWLQITQDRIDAFADCTGDHQWIHVDTERAAREMPSGRTIAHGWLTVSLLPHFIPQLYRIEGVSRRVNYGSNRLRFIQVVPADSRIRAWLTILDLQSRHGGTEITTEVEIELEGSSKPALLLEHLAIAYDD